MALYEAVITNPGDASGTIRYLRRFSAASISQIQSAISAHEPVVAIASEDYPLDHDLISGHALQHGRFVEAIDGLVALGNTVELRYRPSCNNHHEIISREMMKNLMQSELTSLRQRHD